MHRASEILRLIYAWTASRTLLAKVVTGALALGSIGTMIWLGQQGTAERLIPVLDQRKLEANEINNLQMAFAQEGLNEYSIEASNVLVPQSQRDSYLKAIAKHDAIASTQDATSQNSFNPFLTSKQQLALQIEQQKERLKNSLLRLQHIEEAWIEYGEYLDDGPFRAKIRMAVINIRTRQSEHLTQQVVEAIRTQTRGTFPGLTNDHIEIFDLDNEVTYNSEFFDSPEKASRLRNLQQHAIYEKRVKECLSGFPNLRVNVSIDEAGVSSELENPNGNFIVASTRSEFKNGEFGNSSKSLVGSNGTASIRPASFVRQEPATSTTTNKAKHSLVNVSIGVPEQFVRASIRSTHEEDAAQIEWADVQQNFVSLRNQIDQTVRSQIPQSQTGNISIILEPNINGKTAGETESDGLESQPWDMRIWFEQNWKTVVLVVFGICALLILRPTKTSTRNSQ